MSNINETIASIKSRTLAARRIVQAQARVNAAQEAVAFGTELIAALQALHDTLPVEPGSLTANVNDTVSFILSHGDNRRQGTGVVVAVDGKRYRVLVGEGFSQEFKTVFAGQVLTVEAPAAE